MATFKKADEIAVPQSVGKYTAGNIQLDETFQVFQLISDANQLLEDLSNWYVRRNRRRFWKSENDSDKNAAYSTLYSVLMDFIKVLAPIIPFVCDKIYINLAAPDQENLKDSIHLCDFPEADESLTDENILNEVDTVIQIVSLCRSARNKANIKIRQPLAELALHAGKNVNEIALNNQEEILEELNIKSLNLVENESDLVKYTVKPNLPVLGQKYGKKVGLISEYLSKTRDDELIKIIQSDKPFHIQ